MDEENQILTRSGYEKLKRELEALMTDQSAEIAERLVEAREDERGDEAIFFEVMVAKERLNERIHELQVILSNAQVIDDDLDPGHVTPGNRVTVYDVDEKEEIVFDLLSSTEISHGRAGVSTESPVGKALLGHKVGDTIKVEVPDGKVRYKIRKIEMIPDEA